MKNIPPPFPNGWFAICFDNELAAGGEVLRVSAMGKNLVAYRNASGEVRVLDAYCPHMGAHLGEGGVIDCVNGEDTVRCPFHGWAFRGSDGKCVDVTGAKNPTECTA